MASSFLLADGSRARNFYHQCRRRYNSGPRDCDHGTSYPAATLEESIWKAVYRLISNRKRLRRQYEEQVERMRQEVRGDPDREARELAERLAKLDLKRGGYLDLAAEGIMGRDELRAKLSELAAQRKELEGALRSAKNRQQTSEEAERSWKILGQLLDFARIEFVYAGPEARHAIYQALRLRADVDREGTIRLSGIFDPEEYLPDLVRHGPPLDPSKPLPDGMERRKVVVASGNIPWRR